MRRLILRNFQSPGDLIMLTAAVRDLHCCHPDRFLTDVRTSCPALWENNPWIKPLREGARGVKMIDCGYPLIHRSNQEPWHFIHGFIQDLSAKLKVPLRPTHFGGDIHLTDEERASPGPLVQDILRDRPWWLVAAGGKYDYTIKWWSRRRYQEVVDQLQGRVHFVQIGERGHYHPQVRGVTDLRGRTTLRDVVRLTYHCYGVLCGVTMLMHLAAALPQVPGRALPRGGVIIAGGREPPHWEAYPTHQFLHTVGMLPCCATGGCWRSRTVPLGDGEVHDRPEHLCVDVVGGLPRCMEIIESSTVSRMVLQSCAGLPGFS
jgi:hypothetical protein